MPNLITPQVSYPGVYVVELPEGPPAATGVPTSITAFLGRTLIGRVNTPTLLTSFGQFESLFGGLVKDYPLSYSVRDFFANGGTQAIVVRLYHTDPLPPIDPWKAAGGAAALGWLVAQIKGGAETGTAIAKTITDPHFLTKTLGITPPSTAQASMSSGATAVASAVNKAIGKSSATGTALDGAYQPATQAFLNAMLGLSGSSALSGTLSTQTLVSLLDDALLVYEALEASPQPTAPPPLVGEPSFGIDVATAAAELAGGAAGVSLYGVPPGLGAEAVADLPRVQGAAQTLAAMWALTTNPLSNPTPAQLASAAAAAAQQVVGGTQRYGAALISASAAAAAGSAAATAASVLNAVLTTFATDPQLLGKGGSSKTGGAAAGAGGEGSAGSGGAGNAKSGAPPFPNLAALYLGMAGVNGLGSGASGSAGVVLLTGVGDSPGLGQALAKAIDAAQPGTGSDKTPATSAMTEVMGAVAGFQTAQDVLDFLLGTVMAQAPLVQLVASGPGTWGNDLTVSVSPSSANAATLKSMGFKLQKGDLFDVTITYQPPGRGPTTEVFNNLTLMPGTPYTIDTVLNAQSLYVQVKNVVTWEGGTRPPDRAFVAPDTSSSAYFLNGLDGGNLTVSDYLGDPTQKTGIYALTDVDIFNLLCIPPDVRIDLNNYVAAMDTSVQVYQAALAYCAARRAILLLDPPCLWYKQLKMGSLGDAVAEYITQIGGGDEARNAAIYFPHIKVADQLQQSMVLPFAPSGAVAGVIARTDATRGVWKAPAGTEATIDQIAGLQVNLTDADNGEVNLLGLNCLRTFSLYGPVVWGDRTLRGEAQLADEYCYLSVRRLALYIEESLKRSTLWATFEPNAEPLWTALKGEITAFMNTLKSEGAFYAFSVQCDATTTTQAEIDQGVVKVLITFAPVKPAEFVVLYFQQTAGQTTS